MIEVAFAGMLQAVASLSTPAQSVTTQELAPGEVHLGELVVKGRRRGDTGLDPEQELGSDDIYAIGAYDVGEVVARVAETFSPESPPIIVVNGRRLANSTDFLRFPPDALMRVEALPPEASGLYGGDAGQRVINIVMQPQFRSRDALAALTVPTTGGTTGIRGDLRQSEIQEEATLQFGVEGSRVTALWSDERPATDFDPPGSQTRTRAPSTKSFGVNWSASKPVGNWSANIGLTGASQESRSTERIRAGMVERLDQSSESAVLNGGVTGDIRGWDVRTSLSAQIIRSEQTGLLSSRSDYRTLSGDVGLGRRLFALPGGPVRVSLASRHEVARSDVSISEIAYLRSTFDQEVRAQVNAPVLGADSQWSYLGSASLSLGVRARVGEASEGSSGLNASLSWTPRSKVRLSARWSRGTDRPSSRQLLDPLIQSPTRIIYDFLTGRAAEIVTFEGGNPDLRQETSTDTSAGFLVGPIGPWNISGGSTFTRSEVIDDIASLPALTPETEAVFPERFIRDADGTLESVDVRPINIALSRQDSISSTLNFNVPMDQILGRGATVRSSLRHTMQLESVYVLREGTAELDRLAGDGGGQIRHQFAATLDGRAGRWGLDGSIQHRGGYRIRRSPGANEAGDLVVDASTTIDLRLSYKLTRSTPPSVEGPGKRRHTAVDLTIDNLLDARLTVRRGDGRPVPGYGRYDRDAIGRSVTVTVTRRF